MRGPMPFGTTPFSVALAALTALGALGACGSSHAGGDAGPRDAGSRSDAGPGVDGGGRLDGGPGADAGDGWWSCTTNPQCVVEPASCCGRCGVATPEDMVGVNLERLSQQRTEACTPPEDCPECAGRPDPYLVGTCAAGRCGAVNLRADAVTECASASDCVLATPRCCDCGAHGAETAIAIHGARAGRLSELTCDPSVFCPPCVPSFDGLEATCGTDGRCAVVSTTGGT